MNGIHEVTGSIPVWSTIRLAFGSLLGEPKARSWRATFTSNVLSERGRREAMRA